jgi:hypothetical protein
MPCLIIEKIGVTHYTFVPKEWALPRAIYSKNHPLKREWFRDFFKMWGKNGV